MPNIRMLPSTVVGQQTVRTCGRTYTGLPGTFQDVADFDANTLQANGWTRYAEVGATAARPARLVIADVGRQFYDTSLSKLIVWDGATWRDATGASV